MENSKLPRRKMSKTNTRTIGTNTDLNLTTSKCLKCQEGNRKFPLFPYYLPFPYPFCNCMVPYLQNNMMDFMNNTCCKCENLKCMNMCNSHHCLKNCSSSSSNDACTCKNSCTTVVQNLKDQKEKKSASSKSSGHAIKEEPEEYYSDEEVPEESNITKYANDYLQRSKYGFNQKTETDNEDSKSINKINNSKHLLNRLLKPNTTKKVEEEDSDDLIESEENDESETIFEDEELSMKTVIRPSENDLDKDKTVQIAERRPTRVNISEQNSSKRPQTSPAGNKNPTHNEEEMLMMLKALVTTQYDSSSERLNKILKHIDTGPSKKNEPKKSNNASRCSTPKSTSPRKKVNKIYGSIVPKLSDNKK